MLARASVLAAASAWPGSSSTFTTECPRALKHDDTNGSPSRTAANGTNSPAATFARTLRHRRRRTPRRRHRSTAAKSTQGSPTSPLLRRERGESSFSSACQADDDDPQGDRADRPGRDPDLYLTDTIKPGRELWHTHALQLAPNPVVLINHDKNRAIGRVIELDKWDDVDGRWVVARCHLDNPPEWLRGGPRSAPSPPWAGPTSHRQEMPGGWRRYNGGLVTEVSVLTPGFEPVEKLARVVLLQRSTATSSAPRPEPPRCPQTAR